jgi:Ca2+-binding RTX toxin-like protein
LVNGAGGSDKIRVASNDVVHGGAQDDTVTVNGEVNAIIGGAGDDTVATGLGALNVRVLGLVEQVWGGPGDDRLSESFPAPSEAALVGGGGADVLESHDGRALLKGNPGPDAFFVADSEATVFGGDGNDTIHAAGSGRNRIHCGAGVDIVEADTLDAVDADCESVTIS